jgi:hypothetical protein
MDHVVYLDAQANELEKLLSGDKTMLIRGAAGRKMPHGRVNPGDVLYLINNNAEGVIRAQAVVTQVHNSDKLTPEESARLVETNKQHLQLTDKQQQRWVGKRYLVLITVHEVQEVPAFGIDRSEYGNMDDWLPVGDINTVRIT